MGKSTPPPPDYSALATQQGQENEATARAMWNLNHPNETNMYGTRTWTEQGPDRWAVEDMPNQYEQQKYGLSTNLMLNLLGGANDYAMPALFDALQTDFRPPREAQLGWEPDYAPDQRLQTESGMYEMPWLQESLDFSGAAPIPTADQETRRRMEQSVYDMGAKYLDPQFAREQDRLDTKLSNQGIFSGSDAYNTEQQILGDQREQAYGDLRDRAIQGGGQEMANQFGLGMSAHQAGVGDIQSQGAFANAARGQGISELLADMQARNAAIMGQTNMATGQQGGSNTGTQAWLAQKAQSSTLPINIVTALMSGGQVNTPQFQPYATNASWEPAPLYQAGRDQYGAQMSAYNAQQANMGQWAGLAGSIGGAALGGPMGGAAGRALFGGGR